MAELRDLVRQYLDASDELDEITQRQSRLKVQVREAMNEGEVVMLDKQGVAKIGDKLEIVNLR